MNFPDKCPQCGQDRLVTEKVGDVEVEMVKIICTETGKDHSHALQCLCLNCGSGWSIKIPKESAPKPAPVKTVPNVE